MPSGYGLRCFALGFLLSPVAAYPQSGLVCAASSGATTARMEGLAEQLGDILLQCSGGNPGAVVTGNLNLSFNVNVTNRLSATSFENILLTVDTGAGPQPAGVAAQQYSPTEFTFNGVSFTVPSSGKVALRVSNVRGDVNQLGPDQQVVARLSWVLGGATVTSAQFMVGSARTGLLATFSSEGVRCSGSPLPGVITYGNLLAAGTRFFSTRVTEGFAEAYQKVDAFADAGTRIMVSYAGFPAQARLFVPDAVAGSSSLEPTAGGDLGIAASGGQYAAGAAGSLLLVRVKDANADGSGGALAITPPSSGTVAFDSAAEVKLIHGAGSVVYEVVDANPSVRESAQFPTFVGLANYAGGVVVASASVSLAPVSTEAMASSDAPVPRFAALTPPSDCPALGDCSAAWFPHLSVNAPPLEFTTPAGGLPKWAYVQVGNSGAGFVNWTASVAYQTGSGWLVVSPSSGVNSDSIRLDAHPEGLAPGTYQAIFTVDAGPLAGSRSLPVTFTVTPAARAPVVASVTNAASFLPGPLVPGSLATVFGSQLSGTSVSVTFDSLPSNLLYTSDSQINLQVPEQLSSAASAQLVVTADGRSSAPQTVALAPVAPAIFPHGILNQDNTVNGASAPARAGSVIQIFATGLISPSSGPVTGRIHDRDIPSPYYAGPAPGLPGVQQVNLVVPADLPAMTAEVRVCGTAADPVSPVCSPPVPLVVAP